MLAVQVYYSTERSRCEEYVFKNKMNQTLIYTARLPIAYGQAGRL